MQINKLRKRLQAAIFSFWLLLAYIISALVWWYITLEQQNREIASIRINSNTTAIPPGNITPLSNTDEATKAISLRNRRSVKYAGEGAIFLVVTLVGAAFVYRAVKKQLRLNQQQQDFIMAVTHELKTPLAVGRLNIETLQKRKLTEEQQQRLLQNTLVEMQRLNDLTTNILVVSRIDAGAYKPNNEAIHLSALVGTIVADFEKQHSETKLVSEIEHDVFTQGDSLLLKLVVSNLLGNAIKYSGTGGQITITLSGKTKPKLTVADRGPGIADAEKTKIFNKFYRTENESTRNAQGTGLGLYLCKKILRGHKAEIGVSDNQPKGSIFTVTFQQHG